MIAPPRPTRALALTCAVVLWLLAALPPAAAQDKALDSATLRIEWQEFKKLYDAGKIAVVDVRGSDAFEAGHIPGARSVPLDRIGRRAADLRKLGKPIVTYCA